MDIEQFLGSSHMELKKEEIGKIIGTAPSTYRELFNLACSQRMPVCWRAMWLMDYLAEVEPSLPENYISKCWVEMQLDHPVGVKRSMLRMLCRYDIPEDYEGIATDLCLEWVQQESTPIAIKAMSMDILLKIASRYPELAPEFIEVIENGLPYGTGAYISRARRVTGELRKL